MNDRSVSHSYLEDLENIAQVKQTTFIILLWSFTSFLKLGSFHFYSFQLHAKKGIRQKNKIIMKINKRKLKLKQEMYIKFFQIHWY